MILIYRQLRKCPHSHNRRPICWRHFLTWDSLRELWAVSSRQLTLSRTPHHHMQMETWSPKSIHVTYKDIQFQSWGERPAAASDEKATVPRVPQAFLYLKPSAWQCFLMPALSYSGLLLLLHLMINISQRFSMLILILRPPYNPVWVQFGPLSCGLWFPAPSTPGSTSTMFSTMNTLPPPLPICPREGLLRN